MYKLLEKQNFITLLSFEDSYFHRATLPKSVKLSKELLSLNYTKHSPYKNSNILNLTDKKELMLWFYTTPIKTAIAIPESYLAYRQLKKRNEDALYIIDGSTQKVIIIKESKLLSSFVLHEKDESVIALSIDEFELSKKVTISADEYKQLILKAKKSISLKELYSFSLIDLDKKALLKKFVDRASYPIVALILFAMSVSYIQGYFLNTEIIELKKSYKEEKFKNNDIKSHIKKHNKDVKKYREFAKKELLFIDPIILSNSLYTIFKEDEKGYINSIVINEDKMTLQIKSDENPITYLNRLNEISYFKQVVIQNTHKPRRGMKTITYDIEVKQAKDV